MYGGVYLPLFKRLSYIDSTNIELYFDFTKFQVIILQKKS
jgi:hypothetical protein